jgi:hypothetical protein
VFVACSMLASVNDRKNELLSALAIVLACRSVALPFSFLLFIDMYIYVDIYHVRARSGAYSGRGRGAYRGGKGYKGGGGRGGFY